MAVFQDIDRQTAEFQQATGLQCPPGCGKCCQSPTVEVTVLDCLPYAIELLSQNSAIAVLEQLAALPVNAPCIFYQMDAVIPGNGRCGIYAWRPALCRLFGFATVRDKHGQVELATCVEHKASQPAIVAEIPAALVQGLAAPSFSQCTQSIAEIEPSMGTECMPINQAWQQAIERVGLWMQWQEQA